VRRIGYLTSGRASAGALFLEAFRQGLRDLGWVEQRNISIEYRFADDQSDRLPALAADLVRHDVEIIMATPSVAAVAASKATSTIPIVMRGVGDPVGLGLVKGLARPGTNVTGISYSVGHTTIAKGLELLKEAVPGLQSVAILANPSNPTHVFALSNIREIAQPLGVQLLVLEARGPDEFELAFDAMTREHVGGLLVVADPTFFGYREQLVAFTLKKRLASVHGLREEAEAGGLISYGPDTVSQFRQAAVYVDKILKGAKPSELPVEQPSEFGLVINLKTAKLLDLTMPQTLLARANEIVE
jgi:putative ABC transport system substrate-binding protein